MCGAQHGTSAAGEADESWRKAAEEALAALNAETIETPAGPGLRYGAVHTAEAAAAKHAPAIALPAWAKTRAPGALPARSTAPSHAAEHDAPFAPRGDGKKRFRRGRLIHGLLQRLPELAAADREGAALRWLTRHGAEEGEAQALTREALAVLADARFAAVFGAGSRAEAPIIGEAAGRPVRGIVDRLVVEPARVIVLDFKTDRPAPADPAKTPRAYLTQMALYRAVLSRIFPGKAVSCAILWTEAPLLLELPPPMLDAALASFAQG
ncbi:MAG: PD-(D/E)XK nuclease family protein [Terricaulis sp.]|nr:PD-(D/E)XK nuclease family protein [Terricaulis sp.]